MVIPAYNPQASYRRHHRLHLDRQFRHTQWWFSHLLLHLPNRLPLREDDQENRDHQELLREYLPHLLLRKSHWTRSLKKLFRYPQFHLRDDFLRHLHHLLLHLRLDKSLSH